MGEQPFIPNDQPAARLVVNKLYRLIVEIGRPADASCEAADYLKKNQPIRQVKMHI